MTTSNGAPPPWRPCVVCRADTTTGLGFRANDPGWIVAALGALGVPDREAEILALDLDALPGDPPTSIVRVCPSCVERSLAPFPTPGPVAGGQVPVVVIKDGAWRVA